jgi:hypothetical protein
VERFFPVLLLDFFRDLTARLADFTLADFFAFLVTWPSWPSEPFKRRLSSPAWAALLPSPF